MNNGLRLKIEEKLKFIYKENYKKEYLLKLEKLCNSYVSKNWKKYEPLTEKNVYLITYGDAIYEDNEQTLKTLHKFLNEYVKDEITDVHVLPMFEYSSDDGFAVIDYYKVAEKLGNWSILSDFSKDYAMMYDFVANHISQKSSWFQSYLIGDKEYQNYFIEKEDSFDTSNVVRPRTLPLFNSYQTNEGVKEVWTTFSDDQIDLNFKNFDVLYKTVDIMLYYALNGARSIRLDAIGFIWKENGTSCMHLPQAHMIIKLWRDILDYIQPNIQVITETNVPHKENISYFGEGNEASMVYQFALPPLVLYTFTTHNADILSKWASTIEPYNEKSGFFNFLSSHDGIGLRPVESILTKEDIQMLADKVLKNGGRINYKNNTDGSKSPYELCINYQDALLNEEDNTEELEVAKILAAHSILFVITGIPALYYHSLLGSRNDYKGLEESGINRRINREKLEYNKIKEEIISDKRRSAIFNGIKRFIKTRAREKAFAPFSKQKMHTIDNRIFALERFTDNYSILCLVNVTRDYVEINNTCESIDILSGEKIASKYTLKPYEVIWIKE